MDTAGLDTALRIRNVLIRAFVINWLAVVVVWLVSFTGIFTTLMAAFFGFDAMQTNLYMAYVLGFWKILAAVIFLIPALAIHWEYRRKR